MPITANTTARAASPARPTGTTHDGAPVARSRMNSVVRVPGRLLSAAGRDQGETDQAEQKAPPSGISSSIPAASSFSRPPPDAPLACGQTGGRPREHKMRKPACGTPDADRDALGITTPCLRCRARRHKACTRHRARAPRRAGEQQRAGWHVADRAEHPLRSWRRTRPSVRAKAARRQ